MASRPNEVSSRPEVLNFEHPRGDVLADVLGVSLLRHALYKRIEARAPWGLRVAFHQRAVFYLIVCGSCLLEVEGEPALVLSAGEAAFVPHGSTHVLRDASRTAPAEVHDGRRCLAPGPRLLGGDGALTSLVSGFFDLGVRPPTLLAHLPAVVALRPTDPSSGPWVAATLQLLLAESANPGPASTLVMARLADVLFVQTLRSLATGHVCHHRGIAALGDTSVREALALMHRSPADEWTVASLAARVGLSRSSFAARFHELVGEPPLEYLVRWRMTRAAELLRDTDLGMDEVAARVGYRSVPSFSKAFVKWRGLRPGALRRSERERERIERSGGESP
jgi:AraC-like DNA-binding protein